MQHRLDVAEQQLRSLTSLKAALREKEVEIESFKMLAEQESLQRYGFCFPSHRQAATPLAL